MKKSEAIKLKKSQELAKVIGWAGGGTKLAKLLGVTKSAVSQWTRRGFVTEQYAVLIEEKTDGRFKKEKLRPDITIWG